MMAKHQSKAINRSAGSASEVTDDHHRLDGYRQDVGMVLMKNDPLRRVFSFLAKHGELHIFGAG